MSALRQPVRGRKKSSGRSLSTDPNGESSAYFSHPDSFFFGHCGMFCLSGIACGYVTLTVGILTRRNFLHNITRQLFLITALAFVWDFFTGRHGWSLDYVWPCCCSVVLLMMLISLRFFNNKYAYYAFNVIIVCVYGLIPFIALCLHKVQVGWPALVSGIMSLVTLAAYIIFDTKNTKNQMSRKFHL